MMSRFFRLALVLGAIGAGLPHYVAAQVSMQILGNPLLTIDTPAEYQNGSSVTHNTLQLTAPLNSTVTLQVRAAGNLINGVNSIPIGQLYMQVNNTSPVQTEIQVATVNRTIITGRLSTTAWSNRVIAIRYRLTAATSLMKPGGNYTTTLTFTFTAQ